MTKDEDLDVLVTARIRDEMSRALELLGFAVETTSGSRAKPLSEDIVGTIKAVAAKAGVTRDHPNVGDSSPPEDTHIKVSDWTKFEMAYHRLVRYTKPVTAETLHNTARTGQRLFAPDSLAQRFTWLLWLITVAYAALIVIGEWGLFRFSPVQEGEVDFANTLMQLVQILIPYAYGGLDACAYLLRSAHHFIHERSFDLRRTPEYFNRIVLGTIRGGAIVLFVNYVTDDSDDVIQLSSAALGFLGGYSTDFLFNAVERIVGQLLPKLDVHTIKRGSVEEREPLELESGGLTLKDLIERHEKAEGADKEMYRTLIERLRDRM